jgi:hypothetical protein
MRAPQCRHGHVDKNKVCNSEIFEDSRATTKMLVHDRAMLVAVKLANGKEPKDAR